VAGKSVEDKVGEWQRAFRAVRDELTSKELQGSYELLVATKVTGEGQVILELDMQAYAARVNAAMAMARLTAANDRAAATVAAMLVATGIKPITPDYGDDA
jgi:hypothetical protein